MRKQAVLMALVLALLCGGCGVGPGRVSPAEEGKYAVYFAEAERENGTGGIRPDSAALKPEYRDLPSGKGEEEGLVSLLFSGPESGELVSPFPAGVRLLSLRRGENGVLELDLSEAYGGLSGVELTLADGCLALTLCQLPEVKAVYITVEGRARPFRDQILSPVDFALDSEEEAEEAGTGSEGTPEDGTKTEISEE